MPPGSGRLSTSCRRHLQGEHQKTVSSFNRETVNSEVGRQAGLPEVFYDHPDGRYGAVISAENAVGCPLADSPVVRVLPVVINRQRETEVAHLRADPVAMKRPTAGNRRTKGNVTILLFT